MVANIRYNISSLVTNLWFDCIFLEIFPLENRLFNIAPLKFKNNKMRGWCACVSIIVVPCS